MAPTPPADSITPPSGLSARLPSKARLHRDYRSLWPQPATYEIAGTVEPVVVLALAGDDEVRVIRADGTIGRVAEHRIRLERRTLA